MTDNHPRSSQEMAEVNAECTGLQQRWLLAQLVLGRISRRIVAGWCQSE
jgi:hypothetical protein